MSVDSDREASTPGGPASLVERLPGNLGRGLRDNVHEDEIVDAAVRTSAGEAIVVTDRRVLIIRAGFVTGAGVFGARARSIPYSRIAAVDLRLGPLGGHLKLVTVGTPAPPDLTSFKLNNDDNAVTFGARRKDHMKRVATIVAGRVQAVRAVGDPDAPEDLAGRLVELVRAKDAGALTEAEFAQVKSRLLRGA
jgi:hypothetical protein